MSCSPKAISRATVSQVLMRTTGGTMRGIEKFGTFGISPPEFWSPTPENHEWWEHEICRIKMVKCYFQSLVISQFHPFLINCDRFFGRSWLGVVSCCCSKCGNNNWTSVQGMIKSCWLVDQRLPRVSVHFLTSLVVQDYSHQSFCMSDMSVCLQLFQKAKKASEIKLKVPSTASPSETTPG